MNAGVLVNRILDSYFSVVLHNCVRKQNTAQTISDGCGVRGNYHVYVRESATVR